MLLTALKRTGLYAGSLTAPGRHRSIRELRWRAVLPLAEAEAADRFDLHGWDW